MIINVRKGIKRSDRKTHLCLMALLCILIFVYQMGFSVIVKNVLGATFCVALLLFSPQYIAYAMFFMIPSNEYINFNGTSLAIVLMVLYFGKSLLYVQHKKFRVSTIYIQAVVLVYALALWVGNLGPSAISIIKCVLLLHFLVDVLTIYKNRIEELYLRAMVYLGWGIVIPSLLSIFTGSYLIQMQRFSFHADATINVIAIQCSLVIANLMYIMLTNERFQRVNKNKIEQVILIIGCLIVGFLTQSRTFLFISIGVIILCFLFIFSIKQKLKIIGLCCLGVLFFFGVIKIFPQMGETIIGGISRIIDPSNNDISNGRFFLWDSTIETMLSSQTYFWFGAGGYQNVGAVFEGKMMMAHNVFLEMWVEFGVIGSMILFVAFWNIIDKYVFKNGIYEFERYAIGYVPIFSMSAALMFSHHFIGRSMSILFLFSFIPLIKRRNDIQFDEKGIKNENLLFNSEIDVFRSPKNHGMVGKTIGYKR